MSETRDMRQPVSDLTEFLLARIAEDESAAEATGGQFGVYPDTWWGQLGARPPDMNDVDASFIARNYPARVLRECEAKRRIVRMVEDGSAQPGALIYLAEVYRDHPDFRTDLKPWPSRATS